MADHSNLTGDKTAKIISFILLIFGHSFWLLKAKSYVTPELIFPVWLLSNAETLVSEINSFYPQILFYLVSVLNNITNDLRLSVNLVQLTIVLIIDSMLFYYLYKRFNFKFAVIGFVFYIPLQVFFRGNYLWFDIATIPFLAASFFYFERYIKNLKSKNLLFSSVALSLGYFFKVTVFWIYALYIVWLVYLNFTNKKRTELFRNLLFLITPLLLVGIINFLILLQKGTFEFTFYWYVLMQNIIYPRMSTLPRAIETEYYSPMILILAIYTVSCFVIEKFSKLSRNPKVFLYSFTLVSLANIYPRWSDFHVQPLLFFLAIIFTYSLTLKNRLKAFGGIGFNIFLFAIMISMVIIVGNRIATEIKNKEAKTPDYISEYAPFELKELIKNKNIFVYDFPLYNGDPIQPPNELNFYKKINLAIKDPDKYYHVTNWQIALDYVRAKNPNIIIVPYQIHNRIIASTDLTDFERLIKGKYFKESEIGRTYIVYTRSQNTVD